MNNKLFSAIMFTVGAAIGSAVTWKVIKTKYERIAQDEIDSVKSEHLRLMQKMRQKLSESATYEGPQDADADEDVDDECYPDDDERDFTASERAQIEYYKMTTRYRSSDDADNEQKETDEEGGKWDLDEDEVPYINGPYVITPEEFSSSPPGYNAQALNYFTDGVLADDWGVKLDLDEIIGEDAIDHFGEYVDDIVYIRNERLEIDYEVTKDPRTYDEAVRTNPDPYYGTYEN